VIEPLKSRFPTPAGEIGFESARIHSFRHAFVSQSFLDGASEGENREWVGHTNSGIVERYRHLRNEDARRKMDRIDFFGDAAEVSKTKDQISKHGETCAPDVPAAGTPAHVEAPAAKGVR
jgi:hypothetical protein